MASISAPAPREGEQLSHILKLPAAVVLILWIYLMLTVMVGITLPFPSQFDELQQVSSVKSQADDPRLFPDYDRQYVLRGDLKHWSADRNYINHPSLYYFAMSPAMRLGNPVMPMRFLNIGLSFLALVIAVAAGCKALRTDGERIVFTILAASFPKSVEVGGMVNNDNLAAVAGSLVFAGLLSDTAGSWMIAAGLALAGWTKLTALIALGAVALAATLLRSDQRTRLARSSVPILAGLSLGAVPYLWSLFETGHLLHISRDYFVAPAQRPSLGFLAYAGLFLRSIADKWPVAEAWLPPVIAVPILLVPVVMAAVGTRLGVSRKRIALPYAFALIVFFGIHLAFGWHAFETMGDQTIAQSRYYNVLWPGIAFAGAGALLALTKGRRLARGCLLAIYLLPTILGGWTLSLLAAIAR